ncbi:hypothetical protein KUA08_17425, partial [Komagataeibacter melomenusus]|nr:hypothetical protein [Komagataeibacter melomenusus]
MKKLPARRKGVNSLHHSLYKSENMNTNATILFNVNDRLGKVVDYSHISGENQDMLCGNYLREQAELALGGTYIPEETIYCLQIDKD